MANAHPPARVTACRLTFVGLMVVTSSRVFAQSAAERALRAGNPVQAEITAGEVHRHPLAVTARSFVRLRIERSRQDVVATVVDPDGKTLTETDTLVFPPGPASLSVVSEAAVPYRVDVRLAPGAQSAGYRLTVVEERPVVASDASRVVADLAYLEGERRRQAGTTSSLRSALESYERALAAYRTFDDRTGEANALTGLARIRDFLGEKQGALEGYENALALHRESGGLSAAANVMNYMAAAHEHLGDRVRALTVLQEAHALGRNAGDRRVEALTLNEFGFVHAALGDKQRALAFYAEALPVHREAGNPRGEGTTLNNIGYVYATMGDQRRALDHYHQALTIYRALGDQRRLAAALNNIGAAHFSRDELPEAIERYRQALEQWREGGDQTGEAASLHNIARIHEAAGEYQQAIAVHNQALALFRAVSARVREANALTTIGRLYANLGDHRRALAFFEQALPVHRAAGNRSWEAVTLTDMGGARLALGEVEKTIALYEQALSLQRELKERAGEAVTLRALGRAHAAGQDHGQALEAYARALDLFREVQGRRGEAATLVHIAAARSRMGEHAAAADLAQQALATFRALGDRRGEASALHASAVAEQGRARLDAARAHLEEALALVESVRIRIASQDLRSSFLATVQDYYELHVDVLMQLHRQRPGEGFDAQALQASERARARSLLESLSEARGGIREGVDAQLLERERRLQQALSAKAARQATLLGGKHSDEQAAAVAREIDALTTELQTLQAEVRTKSPRYAALTQPQPLALSEIQERVLDRETVLLEYALGAERSYLWVVTPTSIESYELPPRAVVEDAARRFHEAVRARPAEDAQAGEGNAAAAELGRMILSPVAAKLRGRRLVIVPDGALHYVPMAALPTAVGQHRPLIFDNEVVVLPSASTLAGLRSEAAARTPALKTVAVLADPVFDEQDPRVRMARKQSASAGPASVSPLPESVDRSVLVRLVGSRREAAGILALVPPGQGRQALDFAASRATATAGDLAGYRLVHFATHGFLDNVHPELSGLVLSLVDEKGHAQDGFLRLHEVYNLKLPADLVVLSACQTGLGKEVRGEGLVGLTRGFMYAGATRVMTSLWKVDDKATAELMKRFYEGMLGPRRLSPAAALRAAQVGLAEQKRWRAPYYWAGFVLQGEWN